MCTPDLGIGSVYVCVDLNHSLLPGGMRKETNVHVTYTCTMNSPTGIRPYEYTIAACI